MGATWKAARHGAWKGTKKGAKIGAGIGAGAGVVHGIASIATHGGHHHPIQFMTSDIVGGATGGALAGAQWGALIGGIHGASQHNTHSSNSGHEAHFHSAKNMSGAHRF